MTSTRSFLACASLLVACGTDPSSDDGAASTTSATSPGTSSATDASIDPSSPSTTSATSGDPSGPATLDTGVAESSESTGGPPVIGGCDGNRFAFGVFSDNYSGQEGGLARVMVEMAAEEDLHFFTAGGDTPTFERVRGVIDETLGARGPCGASEWPWYPATGNHDIEDSANMMWWATQYADGWDGAAADSRLAAQLPGIESFTRGPLAVASGGGSVPVSPGTIFSFDYKGAHFAFVHDYEQLEISDSGAGVWDENDGDDPTSSQLDWLRADLEATTQPVKFVFGHVALRAPCYVDDACPDSPEPPGWSEHNSSFHNEELTALLVEQGVTAYFHGHDHVTSRMLVDGASQSVYERKYWDVVNDPDPDPSAWEGLQGQGNVWQIDAGRVYTPSGNYVIVIVTPYDVTFEIRAYEEDGDTVAWDSWTMPVAG